MKRRALLSMTASALLFGAGCGERSPGTFTPSTTPNTTATTGTPAKTATTTTTSTSTSGSADQEVAVGDTVSVGDGRAGLYHAEPQRAIFVLDGINHTAIVTRPDAQYLVVSMETTDSVGGHETARSATKLVLDGTHYPVSEYYLPPADSGGFKIAYRVPLSVEASTGRVVWEGTDTDLVAWSLSPRTIQRLNNPPEFEVVSFEVPETVTTTGPFVVSVTVENTGAGDGTFRSEIGKGSYSDLGPYRLDVPRGERITGEKQMRIVQDPGTTETIVLDWGLDRLERTIEIE